MYDDILGDWTYNDGPEEKKLKRKKFDKSSIIPDTEKSCINCVHAKANLVERKAIHYLCEKHNYQFMSYWKQTNARDCENYQLNHD